MRSALSVIALVALLIGCSSRLDAANVTGGRLLAYSKGAVESEHVLTAEQIAHVNSWLATHSDGWEFDAASYAPETLAYLEVREGQSVGLYVYDQSVVYVSGTYQRVRRSKVDETDALKRALGAPDAG